MDNVRRYRRPKPQTHKQVGRAAAVILGGDIQRHRIASGISQRELAERIGTTQAQIARIESGDANPTLATIVRIAAAFRHDLSIGFHRRG